MPAGVNSFLKNIVNAYNKKESKLAEEEKRGPELMPPISSHTLRHTGCTRLGENNVNPKVMQYVMGCWMSSGHPFSTDRSGAKNIQSQQSQRSQILYKKISTRLLTVLITSVILPV